LEGEGEWKDPVSGEMSKKGRFFLHAPKREKRGLLEDHVKSMGEPFPGYEETCSGRKPSVGRKVEQGTRKRGRRGEGWGEGEWGTLPRSARRILGGPGMGVRDRGQRFTETGNHIDPPSLIPYQEPRLAIYQGGERREVSPRANSDIRRVPLTSKKAGSTLTKREGMVWLRFHFGKGRVHFTLRK